MIIIFYHKLEYNYSEYITCLVVPLILSFNSILRQYFVLKSFFACMNWNLIEVRIQLILNHIDSTVVSNGDSSLIISKNLVLFDLRKTWATDDDSRSLIFSDLIVWDVVAWVEKNYTVTVVIDVVVLDPTEAWLNGKDAFRTALENPIVEN